MDQEIKYWQDLRLGGDLRAKNKNAKNLSKNACQAPEPTNPLQVSNIRMAF
jgi:hypothetical protein